MALWCWTVLAAVGLLGQLEGSGAAPGSKEYDYVEVEHLQHGPHGIDLTMRALGKTYDLQLKQAPSVFSDKLKILSIDNGVIQQKLYKGGHPQVFVDSKSNTVLRVDTTGPNLKLEGLLSGEISLLPSKGIRAERPALAVRALNKQKRISYQWPSSKLGPLTRASSTGNLVIPELVQPELLVIVDHKNYEQLHFNESELLNYLSIFWNSVNAVYDQMQTPRVQLVVSAILPIHDPKEQPFIEYALKYFSSGKQLLDLNVCLPAMSMYLFMNIDQIGLFDIGMLMTAEDMAATHQQTGAYIPEVAGVAPVAGACTVDVVDRMVGNVGMAEDKAPYYDGMFNHAHEVAHLLGAAHDGDAPVEFLEGHPGALDCPWSDGYLMSYQFGTKNHLRWSDCTVDQIRWLINNPERGMCLRDSPQNSSVDHSKVLAGQEITLDQQCQAMLGSTGTFFTLQKRSEVCVVLFCMDGKEGPVARGPALEGTQCDLAGAMWCRKGECVTK